MQRSASLRRLVSASCSLLLATLAPAAETLNWRSRPPEDPAALRTPEAIALADNLLAYQYPGGGWSKNAGIGKPLTDAARAALADRDEHSGKSDRAPTIDNGATTTQLRFLAAVFNAAGHERHRDAALRGLDYLLEAQYENGGWPQFFPLRKGYYSHITFNDDATLRVMEILRDVTAGETFWDFVDGPRRIRIADALQRGLACILRCQIVVNGQPTAWAAQHDEKTFAPAPARKFEPACFASYESAGLVRFLMTLDDPSPEVIAAVRGAAAWFERTKIEGIRFERIPTPEGRDGIVTADPSAPPLWARFYELGTERPIFIGRDEIVRYKLEEIERERRGGYAWYSDRPEEILKKFPSWSAKWTQSD